MNRRTFGGFALVAILAACGGEPAASTGTAEAQAPNTYSTEGTIREIRRARSSITIAHEDVPGYMPSMTMPFDVEDEALFEGLAEGDRVRFSFVREEGGRHVIRSIRKI